ncbi:MAG TPA: hypothetical protein VIK26_06570 [Clostridium sp.]
MRIKEINYNNSNGVMVYITKEERCNKDIKEKICNLRKEFKEVAVFVSGENSLEVALTGMIQKRR